jgi:hypothetical protein
MLTAPVLVLNRYFVPVTITSVRRAFVMLYGGIAKAVDLEYNTFDFESCSEETGELASIVINSFHVLSLL